ncbi:hypothetical protein Clacol_007569 [Clathrus columnatus]|uniref:THIF-type NAD/FAD binding fold domain-containing protein n=1 Tax=Clathrus columnatus TaxID=1419009 RepID=A0AAV5AI17_9AGAM|nr:hypothetical protein Clacol_007569 [Clathrus columnatus]
MDVPTTPLTNGAAQTISEDEAALYDRQIRLWGFEAQQRMRNATICVINLRGVATETIKNIVLAGIGHLIVIDSNKITEEDLGAGFFFREDEVGQNRVDVARSRIQNLNPLVEVEAIAAVESLEWDPLIQRIDLLCLTDGTRQDITRFNDLCRKHNKAFYSGGSYGLTGYIFCDLIVHEYLPTNRSAISTEQPRANKQRVVYPSFADALLHNWKHMTRKQARHQNIDLVLYIMTLWLFQIQHDTLPTDARQIEGLISLSNSLIQSINIDSRILQTSPEDLLRTLSLTAIHEFSPVCAVLGGFLGQDILKTLGGRDPSIANLFIFDGRTGSGNTCRLNM